MTAGHCVFDRKKVDLPQCNGRIVDRYCYVDPSQLKVGFLTSSQRTPSESVAILRIIPHPRYSYSVQVHDVSLLRLAKTIQCSHTLMPVCLPQRDFLNLGTRLITAGYGWNTPDGIAGPQILREGLVSVIDPRRCARRHQPIETINNLVCAAGMESGQSSCYGDSGSALIGRVGPKFYAVGVVSYGSFPRCSALNPVAYTKVANVMPFISRVVMDLPMN
ncbi:Chymotrypsin-like protease CTRL-1 like protein [Argiope bruennichi]|uniref:Chymotrypsin-like protease CTRL-1 like protein n=1 Tax=Argiope bruennichi TaxID=94029 RepID=A0A8T0FEN4_ARGBR|nr:Chymotrypsin-like protease CTRL-1 like protein [Argiope bruennichi]